MAHTAANAGINTVIEIPVADIEVSERIGLFWADKALQIGAAIAADGQNDPIKVRRNGPKAGKPWALVTGLHRLRGCETVLLPTIHAIEVRGDTDALRFIEVSENLHRRDFEPLERAMFVRALADIYEKRFFEGREGLGPQQVGQINRWESVRNDMRTREADKIELEAAIIEEEYSAAIVAGLSGWQTPTANEAGISERTLRDCLFIHRTIIDLIGRTTVKQFATHPAGRSRKALMQIGAIQSQDQRRRIIEWLIVRPEAGLEDAVGALGFSQRPVAKVVEGQSKFMTNAGANLDRFSAKSWREWAPALAQKIKPSALIAVRDAIDARIAEVGLVTGSDDD